MSKLPESFTLLLANDVKTNEVGVEAISDVVMQDSVEIGDIPLSLSLKDELEFLGYLF